MDQSKVLLQQWVGIVVMWGIVVRIDDGSQVSTLVSRRRVRLGHTLASGGH